MPRTRRWITGEIVDGVSVIKLSSWKYFHDYVTKEFLDYPSYIWRGQRSATWPLQSSFDRLVKATDQKERNLLANNHLARFVMASRGRRGMSPQRIVTDSEWWALAQHNGMSTPLLDWTESPFVALYFAFEKEFTSGRQNHRAVWGLSDVSKRSRAIREEGEESLRPILEYIRPMQDENLRLVNQSGLFTQLPPGLNVEDWVRENFKGIKRTMHLVKLEIPDDGREECLRALNRMNINHLSLFPDLYGAGHYCDRALQITKYAPAVRRRHVLDE